MSRIKNIETKSKMMQQLMIIILLLTTSVYTLGQPINRYQVVSRHNIEINRFDSLGSLSVGNGNFAFTVDFTGLQTFYKDYEKGVPLGTESNWGWHSFPNTNNYSINETLTYFPVNNRQVPYRHQLKTTERAKKASTYFRENPQRIHLGLIQLVLRHKNGTPATKNEISAIQEQLNLWNGQLSSQFKFDGQTVHLKLYAHQQIDLLAVQIESPLIENGQLKVCWQFGGAAAVHVGPGYDFNHPESYSSTLNEKNQHVAIINYSQDTTHYQVVLNWEGKAKLTKEGLHKFLLSSSKDTSLRFSCLFSPAKEVSITLPDFEQTATENHTEWKKFWMKTGIIDCSDCTDPRAMELERRVILSLYLTKIQCSGNLPPAETGLTYNSWYGKFHLEMHWWHSLQFALWNHPEYLEHQLNYYFSIENKARQTAKEQGYKGVRWPKMVGPNGENSPSSVGSYLIWQQPHLLFFAEQLFKQTRDSLLLKKYKSLIFETADFMADFAQLDSSTGKYNLNPPLIPAQELWPRETTKNPPFELAYWHEGLSIAEQWRKRLGLKPDTLWNDVLQNLPAPDQNKGYYLGIEGAKDSYSNPDDLKDHPMVLGAIGLLPKWEKIDPQIMRNTLDIIAQKWDWKSTWGWDYPMVAMAATKLGEPQKAIHFLMMKTQKNTWLVNGHNYQDSRLRIYLPGNGGLLTAVAMMCAGWDGCPVKNPGFPKDGKWNIHWENLHPLF